MSKKDLENLNKRQVKALKKSKPLPHTFKTIMPCRVKSLPDGIVEIERPDREMIQTYASIALHEYEKNRFEHGSPVDNFLGIAGELAFRQCLYELGLKDIKDFEYVARKLRYWESGDPRKYDFKLSSGLEAGKTIEIATVKPAWKYCIIRESAWKRSSYAVCVQIRWFKCPAEIYSEGKYRWFLIDAETREGLPIEIADKDEIEKYETFKPEDIIGQVVVKGFGTLQAISKELNGWKYGQKGSHYVLTKWDGRYIPRGQLQPIEELWDIIGPSKPKSKGLLNFGKSDA